MAYSASILTRAEARLQQAQRAQGPSDTAFIRLICECELEAQKDYCRMFRIKLPEQRRDDN